MPIPKNQVAPWLVPKGEPLPEVKVQTRADHARNIAKRGGLATQKNNRMRAQGFVVKSRQALEKEHRAKPKKIGTPGNPDPNSAASLRIALKTEENITDKERDRAIRWAHEYIRDFSVMNAWLRIGGNPNSVTSAREIARWPFTLQYLAHIAKDMQVMDIVSAGEVAIGLKKEAHRTDESSSHSARVAAWGKLARILQIDVSVEKHEHTHKGGVMVVPNAPATIDDWESNVVDVQAKLKEDVKQ